MWGPPGTLLILSETAGLGTPSCQSPQRLRRWPVVHALYRKYMNVVDLFNKLRQGVVSMADVWSTTRWDHRHFAEGIGFWEVNVYKALIYFCPVWKSLSHGEFRIRLAWTFLTLGKHPFPADVMSGAGPSTSNPATAGPSNAPGSLPTAPLPGCNHVYEKLPRNGGHTCAYCPHRAYQICMTCKETGLGNFAVCGMKTKRDCMQKHVNGEAPIHASWSMSSPGRRAVAAAVCVHPQRSRGGGSVTSREYM